MKAAMPPVHYDWQDNAMRSWRLAISFMRARYRIVRALKWRANGAAS